MRRVTLLLLAALCQAAFAGDIWVSTDGDDRADGTSEHPLRSLRQALRQAREWRRTGDHRVAGGIHILLRGGVYQLDEPLLVRPEDSGTPSSPTIISSAPGEQARLSGGVSFSGSMRDDGLIVLHSDIESRQMWVNDSKAHRASQFGMGKMDRMVDFDPQHHTITIPTPTDVEALQHEPNLEMLVHQRWAIAILRVASMEVQGSQTIVRFKEPESRIEFEHPWPQPVIGGERGSSSYALLHARQFMEKPGSWMRDGGTYLYHPLEGGHESASHTITLPRLSRLLTIEGYAGHRVHDICWRNLTFEYTVWNRPSRCGHVTLQGGFPIIDAYKLEREGLPWSSTLENQAWIERPESAVGISWAHDIDFESCTFRHLSCTALDYRTGVSDVTIRDNHFEDIGGTAILVGSFGESPMETHRPYDVSPSSEEYSQRIHIVGNIIHDAANEDWGAVGIGAGYVRDLTIERNDVSHVPYSGICVGWGWTPHYTGMANNRIRYNHVNDFALQLYDAGGIYTLSNQPGSLIEGNTVERLGAAPYATNDRGFNIYLDAETDGYTIRGNRCPEGRYGDNHPGPAVVWER